MLPRLVRDTWYSLDVFECSILTCLHAGSNWSRVQISRSSRTLPDLTLYGGDKRHSPDSAVKKASIHQSRALLNIVDPYPTAPTPF